MNYREIFGDIPANMANYGLSIRQPWADCILYHGKRLENRSRRPPVKVMGSYVLIHASKEWVANSLERREAHRLAGRTVTVPPSRLGAVIGMARIKGYADPQGASIVLVQKGLFEVQESVLLAPEIHDSPTQENKWRVSGSYSYILDKVMPFNEPIPCRGMLGFWPVPEDVKRKAWAQIELALAGGYDVKVS